MKRLLMALALVGLASGAWAQKTVEYTPPSGFTLCASGIFCSPGSTTAYRISNGSAAEYLSIGWVSNVIRYEQFVNGGSVRQMVFGASTYTSGIQYDPPQASWYPLANDVVFWGSTARLFKTVYVARSIEGSKSFALTDNVKAAFETVAVAAGSYAGGDIIYTLYCADAADRVSRSGRVTFAAQNTGGTETCAVGTPTTTGDVTNNAKAFTSAVFTCADGGANAIQLEVQADCTIAAPTTLTIEYRNDMPKTNTVTPGT